MARDAFGDELPLVPEGAREQGRSAPVPGAASPSSIPTTDWSTPGTLAGPGGWSGTAATASGAPVVLLAAAGGIVTASLVLAVFAARRPGIAVAGWLLGGFVALGVLGWYTVVDARRRADPWYDHRPWPDRLRSALLIAAALAVTGNALRFADWASRQ